MRKKILFVFLILIVILLSGCSNEFQFRFAVYGDSQQDVDINTNHQIHKKIFSRITAENPDFVIHTGDIVDHGNNEEEWEIFHNITKDFREKEPLDGLDSTFYPTIGNHDDLESYQKYFNFYPINETKYSFDYKNAHFMAYDYSSYYYGKEEKDPELYKWIINDLNNTDKEWIFVYTHYPVYSGGRHYSQGDRPRENIFEEYNVDMHFSGHDHNYQRTSPIYNKEVDYDKGVIYFVGGGGGDKLYHTQGNKNKDEGSSAWWIEKAEKINHYIIIDVYEKHVKLIVKDINGTIIDRWTQKNK
jgi:3',5'-cyclic AMP phosphodiesterase CpdA